MVFKLKLIPLIFILSISSFAIGAPVRLIPVIVAKLPHERSSFTQGLAIEEDQLYESTGLYGRSSLRCLDIKTGAVKKMKPLDAHLFAEGIAVFPGKIFQITWREQKVYVYERHTWQLRSIFSYVGEGWGLCREGNTLWMSNGTSVLTQRNQETFASLRTIPVHFNGQPVSFLNDLEYDGNFLYANVWGTNFIVRLEKETGEVNGTIDASHLLLPQEQKLLGPDEVLNGIAYRPSTGTFFLTGKNWPWIFEVKFIHK